MTQENPTPPNQPPMLEYRAPALDRVPLSKWQIAGGIIFSVVSLPAMVFFGVLTSFSVRNAVPGFVLIGGIVLAINVWAACAIRKPQWKGLAVGLWIGFGIALLIEGLCMASLK